MHAQLHLKHLISVIFVLNLHLIWAIVIQSSFLFNIYAISYSFSFFGQRIFSFCYDEILCRKCLNALEFCTFLSLKAPSPKHLKSLVKHGVWKNINWMRKRCYSYNIPYTTILHILKQPKAKYSNTWKSLPSSLITCFCNMLPLLKLLKNHCWTLLIHCIWYE